MTAFLVGLAVVALGFALYLGYRLARLKTLLEEERKLSETQNRLLKAMAIAAGRESGLRAVFKKVNAATDSATLNQLYKELLSTRKNS